MGKGDRGIAKFKVSSSFPGPPEYLGPPRSLGPPTDTFCLGPPKIKPTRKCFIREIAQLLMFLLSLISQACATTSVCKILKAMMSPILRHWHGKNGSDMCWVYMILVISFL